MTTENIHRINRKTKLRNFRPLRQNLRSPAQARNHYYPGESDYWETHKYKNGFHQGIGILNPRLAVWSLTMRHC